MRRTWLKLYADALLTGTTSKELEPAERWAWIGFLCLAAVSPCEGAICLAPGIGYTDEQLAAILRVPLDILKSAKTKMIQHEKIAVHENNIIEIVNWGRYQSEYSRQKQYRQLPPKNPPGDKKIREEGEKRKICNPKLHAKVTSKSYNQKLQDKVTDTNCPPFKSLSFPTQNKILALKEEKTRLEKALQKARANKTHAFSPGDGSTIPKSKLLEAMDQNKRETLELYKTLQGRK